MPRYVLSGFNISRDGVDDVNLVLRTPGDQTTTSYSYDFQGYVRWDFLYKEDGFVPFYDRLRYDGDRFDTGGRFTFLNTTWGAGRETQVFGVDYFLNGFIAPVAGDSLPDFSRDDGAILLEFVDILNATGGEKEIKKGPYKTGREIELDDLFADNTSGPLIQGGKSDNRLVGKGKADLIVGAAGDDVGVGKGGRDTLMMGEGDDKGYGGKGNDVVSGFDGNDRLWGGKNNDKLFGFNDDDRLKGQGGDDNLFGGDGNDRLDGGKGNDKLTGELGADVFVFGAGYDKDIVRDFGFADRLALNDNLWDGTLTAQEVVDQFASKGGGRITFDFGDGDILVLNKYTNLNVLADLIEIV